MISSWYINVWNPNTFSQFPAKVWEFDIAINILIISWYCDIIMIYQNIKPLHTNSESSKHLRFWYCYWYFDNIKILRYYCDISKYQTPTQVPAKSGHFDIAIDSYDIIMIVCHWENQNIISSYQTWYIETSKMIIMIDIMIFCNIAPHRFLI